jgi:hypothetical protein
MPRHPETRNAPGASRRVVAGTLSNTDRPHHNRAIRDPQRRTAAILSRKYALRFGVALVVAGELGVP